MDSACARILQYRFELNHILLSVMLAHGLVEDDMLFANLLSDGVSEEEKEDSYSPVISYDINWIKELSAIIQEHYRESAKKNNLRF